MKSTATPPQKPLAAGSIKAEGKTKTVRSSGVPGIVIIEHNDNVTAGDGATCRNIPGIGRIRNLVNRNIFEMLIAQTNPIPVAYRMCNVGNLFTADECRMLPFEVVVRNAVYGSYHRRNPDTIPYQILPKPVVEFYLKTSNRLWGDTRLPCDDPLITEITSEPGSILLTHPGMQLNSPGALIMHLGAHHALLPKGWELRGEITKLALRVNTHLSAAWAHYQRRCQLVDFKLEFGLTTSTNTLVAADVITPDECRVRTESGQHIDKQPFREGADDDEVLRLYTMHEQLCRDFKKFPV